MRRKKTDDGNDLAARPAKEKALSKKKAWCNVSTKDVGRDGANGSARAELVEDSMATRPARERACHDGEEDAKKERKRDKIKNLLGRSMKKLSHKGIGAVPERGIAPAAAPSRKAPPASGTAAADKATEYEQARRVSRECVVASREKRGESERAHSTKDKKTPAAVKEPDDRKDLLLDVSTARHLSQEVMWGIGSTKDVGTDDVDNLARAMLMKDPMALRLGRERAAKTRATNDEAAMDARSDAASGLARAETTNEPKMSLAPRERAAKAVEAKVDPTSDTGTNSMRRSTRDRSKKEPRRISVVRQRVAKAWAARAEAEGEAWIEDMNGSAGGASKKLTKTTEPVRERAAENMTGTGSTKELRRNLVAIERVAKARVVMAANRSARAESTKEPRTSFMARERVAKARVVRDEATREAWIERVWLDGMKGSARVGPKTQTKTIKPAREGAAKARVGMAKAAKADEENLAADWSLNTDTGEPAGEEIKTSASVDVADGGHPGGGPGTRRWSIASWMDAGWP